MNRKIEKKINKLDKAKKLIDVRIEELKKKQAKIDAKKINKVEIVEIAPVEAQNSTVPVEESKIIVE